MRVSTRLARPAEFEALRWNGVEADRPAVIKAAARVGIADHPLAVERDDPDVDLASASPAHLRDKLGRFHLGAQKTPSVSGAGLPAMPLPTNRLQSSP